MTNACIETARTALSLDLCAYPAAGHTDANNPKRPFGAWRELQKQRPMLAQVADIYSTHQLTTVGLVCGAISSGLECLDFDTREGYEQFCQVAARSDLASVVSTIQAGYCEKSPKGVHLLYFCETTGRSEKLHDRLRIETRGEGGFVVIAPSRIRQEGAERHYQLVSGGLPSIARISAEERSRLLALIRGLGPQGVLTPVSKPGAPGAIAIGGRNNMLTSLAGSMQKRGMSMEALTAALHAENKARCDPPLPDHEVRAIVHSVARYRTDNVTLLTHTEWKPPRELPSGIPSVRPFNADSLLPQDLAEWVKDHAYRLQCPPDYPAVGLVVALSSVIGGRLRIRPKQLDTWAVTPNLWGLVIGRPSTLKSPAMTEALRPLKELEAAAETKYRTELAHYEAQRTAYELALGHTKKQATNKNGALLTHSQITTSVASVMQQQPVKPVRQRYIVNDASVEKLGEILAENDNGVLVFRDEIKGVLAELDGEENATKRAFMLQAWDGNGSYDFDRIGRGHIHIPRTIVSMLGTTQPGVIESYLAASLRGGVGDDGLMQRFQLAVYPDDQSMTQLVDAMPNLRVAQDVSQLFRKMANIDPNSLGAQEDNIGQGYYLRFSPDAQGLFDAWYVKLIAHMQRAEHAALASHFGKYRSLVPSLALIFHLAAGNTGPVDKRSLELAIRWSTYLKSHAERIYSYSIRADALAAQALGGAIKAGKLKDGFALRDLQRKGWTGLSGHERCAQAIEILAEHDWLAVIRVENNGKIVERCSINPALLPR